MATKLMTHRRAGALTVGNCSRRKVESINYTAGPIFNVTRHLVSAAHSPGDCQPIAVRLTKSISGIMTAFRTVQYAY